MATSDGWVYVLSVEVNPEEDGKMENYLDRERQRTPQGILPYIFVHVQLRPAERILATWPVVNFESLR